MRPQTLRDEGQSQSAGTSKHNEDVGKTMSGVTASWNCPRSPCLHELGGFRSPSLTAQSWPGTLGTQLQMPPLGQLSARAEAGPALLGLSFQS